MQPDLLGALSSTLSALLFAINVILIRRAMVTGEPLDAVMAMLWGGTITFLPVSILLYYPKFSLNAWSIFWFIMAGIIPLLLGRICYYEGTKLIGASRTAAISQGYLIVTSAIATIILREHITMGHSLGIFLILLGIVLVSYETEAEGPESDRVRKLGVLFPLAVIFLWGLGPPFVKAGLSGGTPVFLGLTIQFSSALFGLIGYFCWKGYSPLRPFLIGERRLYLWASFLFSFGFLFWYLGLSVSRVVVTQPFRSLTPLFTLALSNFFLYRLEKITRILVLGAVLAVSGSVLIGISM